MSIDKTNRAINAITWEQKKNLSALKALESIIEKHKRRPVSFKALIYASQDPKLKYTLLDKMREALVYYGRIPDYVECINFVNNELNEKNYALELRKDLIKKHPINGRLVSPLIKIAEEAYKS